MFKNLIVYRLSNDWQPNAEKLEDALENERFAPCGATEALSAGWVPPRGEPGARLLEEIDGHWLLSLRMEKRVLPGSVVREKVEEMVERIELETGRRPGKKQQRDMKEQATCQYTVARTRPIGGSVSPTTESEYSSLLGLTTGRRRSSTTTD